MRPAAGPRARTAPAPAVARGRRRGAARAIAGCAIAAGLAAVLLLPGCMGVFGPGGHGPGGGQSLYDYNLSRGAIALNDYDYANLETHDGLKHYLEDGKVVSQAGIDVAEHQHDVNWSKVRADGIDFAMLRIGYRGYTEGGLFEDGTFRDNAAEAQAAGLGVGAYFFSQALDEDEAREEAALALDVLAQTGVDPSYPVAYDLEIDAADNARTANLDSDQVTRNARAFCEEVAAAGYTPMVYLNKNAALNQFDLSQLQDYGFWYAEYGTDAPTLGFDFSLWQYSSQGEVYGIDGSVDLNIAFRAARN